MIKLNTSTQERAEENNHLKSIKFRHLFLGEIYAASVQMIGKWKEEHCGIPGGNFYF